MAVIGNVVYLDGRRCAVPPSLEMTYETMSSSGGMGWIGLYRPDSDEVGSMAQEFSLHPLVVEDTIKAHQRPKIERYDDVLLTVLRPARYLAESEVIELGELHVLTGPTFVITSRYAETPDLGLVRQRLEGSAELLRLGPEAVLYAVLDQVVDEYEPVVEGVASAIDGIELDVFDGNPDVSRRIFALLRQVIEFQRATAPLAGMLDALEKGFDKYGVDPELRRYLRDVEDHAIKVIERVEGFRSLLEHVLTVNATLVGQRQNEEMERLTKAQFAQSEQVKKISSWAAILFVPSLVASVYGMNFDHMPELGWDYGYPMSLLVMLAGAVTLYAVFKRRNWI